MRISQLTYKLRKSKAVFQEYGLAFFFQMVLNAISRRVFRRREQFSEIQIAFNVLTPITKKGVMVDVGAHHGESCLPFALQGWQVFAFEPDASNFRVLVQVLKGLPSVEVVKQAVADHSEEQAVLYKSDESTGISALHPFRETHKAGEQVAVTTLGRFLNQRGIASVDFLKIDTEGFDLFVLHGVPWEEVKPRLVLCEFDDQKTQLLGYTFHDLAQYLIGQGYKVLVSAWYPVEEFEGVHRWKGCFPYNGDMVVEGWGNIFATWDEQIYQSLAHQCIEND